MNAIVECRGLSKRYGSTVALDQVDLSLDAGAPIALIGPNGAGKTTFLSLLCGYIYPSRGEALVLGQRPGSHAVLAKLAALPQDAQLDPRFAIVRQLMFYGELQGLSRRQARREAQRVLEQVQLADGLQRKPAELSHGMRKRVLIAQALLGKPEVVLLDEPTAGLDPPNVKIIRDLITASADKMTFIISSHNLDELERVCQQVVYLEQGRLKDQVDLTDTDIDGYLTVRLSEAHHQQMPAIVESLQTLAGVKEVVRKPQGHVVVHYDLEHHPALDQQLLQHLASNQWHYRQLIKGRTLEDKLFSFQPE